MLQRILEKGYRAKDNYCIPQDTRLCISGQERFRYGTQVAMLFMGTMSLVSTPLISIKLLAQFSVIEIKVRNPSAVSLKIRIL